MAAGTKRPNLQTGVARRHSLHRKVSFRLRGHLCASRFRADINGRYAARSTRSIVELNTAVVVLRKATHEGRSLPLF